MVFIEILDFVNQNLVLVFCVKEGRKVLFFIL